jgi:hypothetical protein
MPSGNSAAERWMPSDASTQETTAVDRGITTAGVTVGILIGFVAGVGFAVARRAWVDYTKTKDTLPGLKTTAWAMTRTSAGRFMIAGVLVVLAVLWAVLGD